MSEDGLNLRMPRSVPILPASTRCARCLIDKKGRKRSLAASDAVIRMFVEDVTHLIAWCEAVDAEGLPELLVAHDGAPHRGDNWSCSRPLHDFRCVHAP